MKKQYFIILITLLMVWPAVAQDLQFTQVLNHPLQLNPALISSSNDFRINLGHRAQWQAIDKGYQSESFTMIHPVFLKKDTWKEDRGNGRLDIGLGLTNDRVGAFNTSSAILAVSSGLKISESQFASLALYGGYIYKMLDVNNLTFDEQYIYGSFDPNNGTGETLISDAAGIPDVGFGLAWYYVPNNEDARFNAYAGMSGYHMHEFNSTLLDMTGKIYNRLSLQAGAKFLKNDLNDFSVHTGYVTQGGFSQFYLGLLTGIYTNEKDKIVFGGWFRQQEALALQLGYHHRSFFFDISYDFPYTDVVRSLNNLTTWEVALGYKFNRARKKSYMNYAFF
jgi:type IX secretion system PorP/SprF family membrane protein